MVHHLVCVDNCVQGVLHIVGDTIGFRHILGGDMMTHGRLWHCVGARKAEDAKVVGATAMRSASTRSSAFRKISGWFTSHVYPIRGTMHGNPSKREGAAAMSGDEGKMRPPHAAPAHTFTALTTETYALLEIKVDTLQRELSTDAASTGVRQHRVKNAAS